MCIYWRVTSLTYVYTDVCVSLYEVFLFEMTPSARIHSYGMWILTLHVPYASMYRRVLIMYGVFSLGMTPLPRISSYKIWILTFTLFTKMYTDSYVTPTNFHLKWLHCHIFFHMWCEYWQISLSTHAYNDASFDVFPRGSTPLSHILTLQIWIVTHHCTYIYVSWYFLWKVVQKKLFRRCLSVESYLSRGHKFHNDVSS